MMMMIPSQGIIPKPAQTTKRPRVGPRLPNHNQKGEHLIMVKVPKEACFDLPEGRYRARVSNLKPMIRQAGQGPQAWLRICFEVVVPGLSETQNTLAGRSFRLDLNTGSDLRNFLTGFLGKDYFKALSGTSACLNGLIGAECEVQLEHFYGHGYDKPLVTVAGMYPVGPAEAPVKD